MAGSSEDELARTATAAGTPSQQPAAPALTGTLGRYRIERTLGEGGMGVVHAAFDPDLERRVALKVLRTDTAADEARQRLLREARAMARLTHPNVVTVHEVGSANGRDYVAMELVEGETLAEWLRAAHRTPDQIVEAFVAAGRGLAAAHAAGLVHRDFKPHNVLRRKDGRVCVTDFGLARGVEEASTGFEATVRLKPGAAKPDNTPSSLSGLTATGSVLGTPAYMAPEQWTGGTVGPAADQFAFCVALWEALTGERPFKAPTFEELKREVAGGGRALDASKLPRRLREPLRRGLDPDPAKRWPSMDALIDEIAGGRQRRAVVWAMVSAGVLAVAIAGLVIGLPASNRAAACAAPEIDPDSVWSASRAAALAAAGRADVRDALARDIATWHASRDAACKQLAEVRAPRLACLDGVLAHLQVVGQAIDHVTGDLSVDAVLDQLVDPHVCEAAAPPRLTLRSSPETVSAVELALESERKDKPKPEAAETVAHQAQLGSCGRAIAALALASVLRATDVPKAIETIGEAMTQAETCGDDRLLANVVLAQAAYNFEAVKAGPKARAATERAAAAVSRVGQADLTAMVDLMRAEIAIADQKWDEAMAAAERALAALTARGYKRRPLDALDSEISAYFTRNHDGDMARVLAVIAKERPLVAAMHDDDAMRSLDNAEGLARLFDGDLATGHAEIVRNWKPSVHAELPTQAIDGVVVDASGTPVAGATVVAGQSVWIDSLGVLPFQLSWTMRMTTTDARGAFAFSDAPQTGGLAALAPHAVASAPITAHSRLVLAPTRRIAGHVNLHGMSYSATLAVASDATKSAVFVSPVARDGSFAIDGAPTTALKVGASTWQSTGDSTNISFIKVPAGSSAIDQLSLDTTITARTFDVVVRSAVATPLDIGDVFLLPGKHMMHSVAELKKLSINGGQHAYAYPPSQKVPEAAAAIVKPGDLVAHFTEVHDGELTACALGLQGNFQDPKFARLVNAHVEELALYCAPVAANDRAVVVVASPQKRFD
jgi:predicted Ser/Thr protein kinase